MVPGLELASIIKMAVSKVSGDEKLAEVVRNFPILYNKESKDFKDKKKKDLVWNDIAKEVGFSSGKRKE